MAISNRLEDAIDDYLKEMDQEHWCMRLKPDATCTTRKCLIFGGYSGRGPVDPAIATCPRYRLHKALEEEQ
jgi:hypothetical protein